MLQSGETLDGYRLIRQIGSGGFGEVWLCQSPAVGDFRALKFIPATGHGYLEKEFDALCRYRAVGGRLRSPSIMPIEHVNRRSDGLFYIMPLSDGYGGEDPSDPGWFPVTMTAVIETRRAEPTWFSIEEIRRFITPILEALQLLSDAGLVHRDIKPDNILFVNGTPCLADISLLGADTSNLTRRGTPGYSAPSWFLESGGHPDMYGIATTLFSILTGNPADKMGRSAFRWPPQGEQSLSPEQKIQWLALHRLVSRAVDDRITERFTDFNQFARCLSSGGNNRKNAFTRRIGIAVAIACISLTTLLFLFLVQCTSGKIFHKTNSPPLTAPSSLSASRLSIAAQTDIRGVEDDLSKAKDTFLYSREDFSSTIDSIALDLDRAISGQPSSVPRKKMSEIMTTFMAALMTVPKYDTSIFEPTIQRLYASVQKIETQHGLHVGQPLRDQIRQLERHVSSESSFRQEQMLKIHKRIRQTLPGEEAAHSIENAADWFESSLADTSWWKFYTLYTSKDVTTQEAGKANIQEFNKQLAVARQELTYSREEFAAQIDAITSKLDAFIKDKKLQPNEAAKQIASIHEAFASALNSAPKKPSLEQKTAIMGALRTSSKQIGDRYGLGSIQRFVEEISQIEKFLDSESEFRREQMNKVLSRAREIQRTFALALGSVASAQAVSLSRGSKPSAEELVAHKTQMSAIKSVNDSSIEIIDAAQGFGM